MRNDRAPKVHKFCDRIIKSYLPTEHWLNHDVLLTNEQSVYDYLSDSMHRKVTAIEEERDNSTPTP